MLADPAYGRLLLAPLLPRFMERYPDIPLEVEMALTRARRARASIGTSCSRTARRSAKGLVGTPLGRPPMILCATPGLPARAPGDHPTGRPRPACGAGPGPAGHGTAPAPRPHPGPGIADAAADRDRSGRGARRDRGGRRHRRAAGVPVPHRIVDEQARAGAARLAGGGPAGTARGLGPAARRARRP